MTQSIPPAEPYVANTSGDRSRAVPLQAQGGSWGAFVFGGIWALSNRVWVGALCFLPLLALIDEAPGAVKVVAVLVGGAVWGYVTLCGRSLAWTRKRWNSYEHFRDAQKAWSTLAKIIFGLGAVSGGLLFLLFAVLSQGLSHMNG
jgi:hypothetical protein